MADFHNHNVLSISGLTAAKIDAYVNPKAANASYAAKKDSVMMNIGALMIQMEKEFGVNAGFLVAVAALESGWGTSRYARENYSLFGYGAYNSNPDATKQLGGGNTLTEGLRKSCSGIVKYINTYNKRTINQFQTYPYAWAQQDSNGTPTQHWADQVASIWAGVMNQSSDGTYTGKISSGYGSGVSTLNIQFGMGRKYEWATYDVLNGEGIRDILRKNPQVTEQELLMWNGVKSVDDFRHGMKIRIYPVYKFRKGDKFEDIARDFSTTMAEIRAFPQNKNLPSTEDKTPDAFMIRIPYKSVTEKPTVMGFEPTLDFDNVLSINTVAKKEHPLFGKAPSPADDDYPAHRYSETPFACRIGDTQFFIPQTAIQTEKTTSISSRHTLRSKNGIFTKSGNALRKITISILCNDSMMINGWPVNGPGGMTYYMDGLRSLVAQFMKTPFLPIRNELLNNHHKIFNVALYGMDVETIDDFPGALNVILTLVEFTQEPFTGYPDFFYDDLFMYPLFRWWYQQLLNDNEKTRMSSTYLRPVPYGAFDGVFKIHALSRSKLEAHIELQRDPYALAKLKMPIYALMEEWDLGNIIVKGIKVSLVKDLKPIHTDDHEIPVFQDMGGIDREVTVRFLCDREALESINDLTSYLEGLSLDFRHRFVSGFLNIDNEVINMMGIYNAMIVGLTTSTVEGFDDTYEGVMILRAFDPTQKNTERLQGVNAKITPPGMPADQYPIDSKADRKNEILYETMVEKVLNSLELYPDLELPTYTEVNEIIPLINAQRISRGRHPLPIQKIEPPEDGVYVDPDFYMAYPDMKTVFDALELGQFGEEIVSLLGGGTYLDERVQNVRIDPLQFLDGQNMDMEIKSLTDIQFVPNWKDEEHQNSQRFDMKNRIVDIDPRILKIKSTPVGHAWDGVESLPQGDEHLHMMCHDMIAYGKRGRMVKAFPTYLLLFIDEGMWVDGRRLWNNYYAYHAIHNVDVVKTKDNPVDLAFVSLSNIYGAFDFNPKLSDPRKYTGRVSLKERVEDWWKNDLFFTIQDKQIQERTRMLEHAKLREGARIHIRLGYGSTASSLPISFNGHIASVNENEGDVVEIVCQGDGSELVSHYVSTEPGDNNAGFFGAGQEAQNIFRDILAARTSNFFFSVGADVELFDNFESKYGIEHFGFIESKGARADEWGWTALNIGKYAIRAIFTDDSLDANVYDIMKNVHKSRQVPDTVYTESWHPFDDEINLTIDLFRKTPWDAFQTYALFNSEFIVAPHPHGFRSTLFFGMPHWMVKHRYVPKTGVIAPKNINDVVEYSKPFQQFHIFMTGQEVIANKIKASSELIKHVAVGLYTKGGGGEVQAAYPVYADRTIKSEYQKTMMVDTQVTQDLLGWDKGYDVGKYLIGSIFDIPSAVTALVGEGLKMYGFANAGAKMTDLSNTIAEAINKDSIFTPGDVQARTVAIGALQRSFAEMYQGELILFGCGSLKPWDLFYLSDSHRLIAGTAQVGKVTHSFGRDTGFISVVKPDLVVARSDSLERNAFLQAVIYLGSFMAIKLGRRLLASKVAKKLASASLSKGIDTTRKALSMGGKVVGQRVSARLISWTTGAGNAIKGGVSSLRAMKGIEFFGKAKHLVKGNIITTVLAGVLVTWIEEFIKKEFMFNNVLYIFPLWKADKPFVAGITGAKYIIPNYVDPETLRESDTQTLATGTSVAKAGANVLNNQGNTFNQLATQGRSGNATMGSFAGGGSQSVYGQPGTFSLSANHTWNPNSTKPLGHIVIAPVDKMAITSRMGQRKNYKGELKSHNGIDIAPIGPLPAGYFNTPVRAIADGVVKKVHRNQWGGNMIEIHVNVRGEQYYCVYMHLRRQDVREGQTVKAGDIIGIMGNTGDVWTAGHPVSNFERQEGHGTHLHFELYKGNSRTDQGRVDPMAFFARYGIPMSEV